MREALRQAQIAADNDEVPVGAVITYQRRIIARAYNQVEMLKDPTAHAEMIALTQATHFLDNKWLQECTLYVTIEPCHMCAGAIVLARMKRLVYGAADPKAGACGSLAKIVQNHRLNHRVDVVSDVLQDECRKIISDFFLRKRQIAKTQINNS